MKPQIHLESVIEGLFNEKANEGLENFLSDKKSLVEAVRIQSRKRKGKWNPKTLEVAARRQKRLDRLEKKLTVKLPPLGWIKYEALVLALGFSRTTAYDWRVNKQANPECFKGRRWWISPEEASRLVTWLRSVDSPAGGCYVNRSPIIATHNPRLKSEDIKAGNEWLSLLLNPVK